MKSRVVSGTIAVAMLGIAGVAGVISAKRVAQQVRVGELCEATSAGDWDKALSYGEDLAGPSGEGRIAAECLCWAYAATSRLADCAKMVDNLLSESGSEDWVPDITVVRLVVRERKTQGRYLDAAVIAGRAARKYPEDTWLLEAELVNRSVNEDEKAVLEDMASRLTPDLRASIGLRLVLSAGYERRGDYEASLEVLGETPPPLIGTAQMGWFEARAAAFGGLERREDVWKTYQTWEAVGGNPSEMRARYGIRVSMYGLKDPDHSRTELLELALAEEEKIESESLRRSLFERLIGHYLVDGRVNDALSLYDLAEKRFDKLMISRDEIRRSASTGRLSDLVAGKEENALVFRAPAGGPSGTLLVSPRPGTPADTPFVEHALAAGGEVRVKRHADVHPQRWVFRDEQGRTVGSGNAWSDLRETIVEIEPREPQKRSSWSPTLRPGDGRRRVFVVIPDCEDWRLLRYLNARGDMPVHDYLLEHGYRGVLKSVPAFTGAAMESLVWPTRGRHVTFLGVANRLGIELGGLASVGKNPLSFLQQVLPEGENLFERLGQGPYVTANLLFSHGYIDAGSHAELIGPHGQRRPAANLRAFRPLRPEESADLPQVMQKHPAYRAEVEKMAAEFDSAVNLAEAGEVDLLVIRIEPLDILTHTFYTGLMRSGQDDARNALVWAYRYLDGRLAEVWQALDADDVFVVMSDHGIRTALEHDQSAVFVAVGDGVPKGRAKGQPHLRGIPRFIADLFATETDWPDTQIADWPQRMRQLTRATP